MQTIKIDRENFVTYCRGGCIFRGFFQDRQFAVKYITDKRFFEEVQNEAKILSFLDSKNCAHVPKYYRSYLDEREGGVYFVICDFINGEHLSFEEEMSHHRREQYLNALSAIHEFGILHDDLSEKNFLATDNKVFIIDFGFSWKAKKSELEHEYNQLKKLLNININPSKKKQTNQHTNIKQIFDKSQKIC